MERDPGFRTDGRHEHFRLAVHIGMHGGMGMIIGGEHQLDHHAFARDRVTLAGWRADGHVALLDELLVLNGSERVLDVGAGTGAFATTSSANVDPSAPDKSLVRGGTGLTSPSRCASTSLNGVSRAIRCGLSGSTTIGH